MYKSKKLGCHPPQIPLKVGLGAPILDAPTLEVKWRILFVHARRSNVHSITSSLLQSQSSWRPFMASLLHRASLGGASSVDQVVGRGVVAGGSSSSTSSPR